MGEKFCLFSLPALLELTCFSHFTLNAVRDGLRIAQDVQLGAEPAVITLQLLLAVTQRLHLLRKLLVILFAELSGLLELLVLRLVLFEDLEKLLLFFDFHLGLLLVCLDLLFELFSLSVNLCRQRVLNTTLLAVLLTQLLSHELHLFTALFLELFILDLQICSLFLNQLVFLPRLGYIFGHLCPDSAEMLIEVFEDVLALGLLVVLDGDMTLLELLVLAVVLPRDLLVLLPNHVGFGASILVLKCLLVEKLLFDLCLDGRRIDLFLERLQAIEEQVIDGVRALLERHLSRVPRPPLQLVDLGRDLPTLINKITIKR